jgi:anti-sigma regulatory factor (Ser/Thr protein kinase)
MAEQFELDLPADVSAAKRARIALARWSVTAEADLVVSELVTNAVLYGEIPISLAATRTAHAVRVEVIDSRPDFGPPTAQSRGLRLVEAFSTAWGVTPCPGDGKIVWVELPG